MDELILGFCFETHRACKVGTLFLDETDEQNLRVSCTGTLSNMQGTDVITVATSETSN